MIVVRETFAAKAGKASTLAKLFKKVMPGNGNVRVLTDYVGEFNTVVIETEVKDLSEFEGIMKEYQSGKYFESLDKETKEAASKYAELYQTGRREVFKVIE